MENLWNDDEAAEFIDDLKQMRVYTSRLLGRNPDLVLHGGGNTSVKLTEKDFFGDDVDLLFVKGSGWDLATIEVQGFTPLRMDTLLRLAECESLSDTDMVTQQRVVMLDPNAPNASVEAILHAVIPFRFVDHTHADSIVALTNTPNGEERVREVFGDRIMIVPYVMPGFVLARKIYEMTQGLNWDECAGMVLMNHGLFTFGNDARSSYEATINLVSKAEAYLQSKNANEFAKSSRTAETDLLKLAKLRKVVSETRGVPVVSKWDSQELVVGYSELKHIADVGTRGPVTPDHSIRTRQIPVVLNDETEQCIQDYADQYKSYFEENKQDGLTCLDSAPRWAIWPGNGIVSLGASYEEASIISDIAEHTAKVIQQAEALGGWQALSAKEVFDVEYWELEQAKLRKKKTALPLQGKIALVTGAASGIGRACAENLHEQGAAVVAADINPVIDSLFDSPTLVGHQCDVCSKEAIQGSIEFSVSKFGGLDIVVSNAGVFSQGQNVDSLTESEWDRALQLNLTQHKNLLQQSIPFLRLGIDPTFILIGSKNVAAPGPGASAYSVSKAAVNQLMRVAAIELGADGIRVNTVHPDCVFDTGLWSSEVLETRAEKYGMTVEEYKSRNVLKQSVTSREVAVLVGTMAGSTFLKTTGAQIPIDGGNERVI